jgi:hypothetical protein
VKMRNSRFIALLGILAVFVPLTVGAQPVSAGKDLLSRLPHDRIANYEALSTVLAQLDKAGIAPLDADECYAFLSNMTKRMPNAGMVLSVPHDPAKFDEFLSRWKHQLLGASEEGPFYPPFDPTGLYEGEWWSGAGAHCPLSSEMTLPVQGSLVELWAPTATITMGFDCISPGSEPANIQTLGLLDKNGNLVYLALGCTTGFCLLFGTNGVGIDVDEDGLMDTYSGEWAFIFGIAFIPVFGFAGEFELTAVPVIQNPASQQPAMKIPR